MKKSYSDLLKDPRWQKKRLEILQRDEFKCRFCGSSRDTLHVHHLKYAKTPWDIDNIYLITICDCCHCNLHARGEFEIVDDGILSVVDYIFTDPRFITRTLSYIENHKGIWIIEFRKNIFPDEIIKLISGLYLFMSDLDIALKIKIREPFECDYDVFPYLNSIKNNKNNE